MAEISVLLTVRNWGIDRVWLCLRSLVESEDVTSQIIVLDYGSDDGQSISRVCQEFGAEYHRVEASEWSRSLAMNAAASKARSEFLIFADADLLFAPSVLAATVRELKKSKQEVLLFGVRDLPSSISTDQLIENTDFDFLDKQSIWRPRWGMGMQAYRTATFNKVRGFDERMRIYGGEDNDIGKRARYDGNRLRWVNGPEFGLYHVWHPSSRKVADSDPAHKELVAKNAEISKNDPSRVRNLKNPQFGTPLVSVVITTYNRADYVAQSINSVLAQTVDNLEVIVLDDGSTDETQSVIGAINDDRVRYFKREKSGIPVLRNEALDLAQGRYIAVHDDDDIMLPWSLETRLKCLRAGDSGSYGAAYNFDNDTGAMELLPGRDCTRDAILNGGKVFLHGTLLIEKSVMAAVRYDERYASGSDYNLAIRLTKAGIRLRHCQDVVLLRRLHHRQVSIKDQATQHSASFHTNFAQRIAWGGDTSSKSRALSKAITEVRMPEWVVDVNRSAAFLPDHLTCRFGLIAGDPDGGVEVGKPGSLPSIDSDVVLSLVGDLSFEQASDIVRTGGTVVGFLKDDASQHPPALRAMKLLAGTQFSGPVVAYGDRKNFRSVRLVTTDSLPADLETGEAIVVKLQQNEDLYETVARILKETTGEVH